MFEFKIEVKQQKSIARLGLFTTPHGKLRTPEYTFIATSGEIKAIPKEILVKLPVNLIIVNTFHIFVKGINNTCQESIRTPDRCQTRTPRDIPTFDIHEYSGFNGPIMSDSGGFQVFSLGFGKTHKLGKVGHKSKTQMTNDKSSSKLKIKNNLDLGFDSGFDIRISDLDNPLTITEEGVTFTYDGRKITLTPENSMAIQNQIGADIIFAFDECTSPLNSKKYTEESMERTHRWLERCLKAHKNKNQALFAIVQGGEYEDLRITSAKFAARQDVPGFGIGGSLGKYKEDTHRVLDWSIPHLPEEKPRHFLGIGRVEDVLNGVERGIDTFDCVIPTREARHKVIYTFKGKVNLRKMKNIDEVIDKNCKCLACKEGITYKKLYELFVIANEVKQSQYAQGSFNGVATPAYRQAGRFAPRDDRAFMYATIHNIQFFSDLMKKIRESIEKNAFFDLKNEVLRYY